MADDLDTRIASLVLEATQRVRDLREDPEIENPEKIVIKESSKEPLRYIVTENAFYLDPYLGLRMGIAISEYPDQPRDQIPNGSLERISDAGIISYLAILVTHKLHIDSRRLQVGARGLVQSLVAGDGYRMFSRVLNEDFSGEKQREFAEYDYSSEDARRLMEKEMKLDPDKFSPSKVDEIKHMVYLSHIAVLSGEQAVDFAIEMHRGYSTLLHPKLVNAAFTES